MKAARIVAVSAENDEWLRRATATAVAAVKELIGPKELIRSDTPAGGLDRCSPGSSAPRYGAGSS